MPRIPRTFSRVRPTAGIIDNTVRSEVSRSGQMAAQAEISKGEVQAGVFQNLKVGMDALNAGLQKAAEENTKRLEADYLTNKSLEFQKQSMDHYNQSRTQMNPYGEGFADSINQFHQDRIQDIVSQAPSAASANIMLGRLGQYSLRQSERAFKDQQAASVGQTKLNYEATVNTLANQAFQSPGDAATYLQQAEEGLKGSSLDPATIQALTTKAQQDIRFNQVSGLIELDPVNALTGILQGEYNDLDNSGLLQLSRKAASKIKGQMKELKSDQKNMELRALYHSPAPFDPNSKEHKASVNLIFNEDVIPNLDEDPVTASGQIIDFFEKKPGIIPKRALELFNGAVINGTPEQKELWARTLVRMNDNPKLRPMLDQVDKDARSEAFELVNQLNMGQDITTASEIVRDQIKIKNDQEIKARKDQLVQSGALRTERIIERLRDEFDVEDVSGVQEIYRKEYERHFTQHKGGNSEELAHKAAMTEVMSKYSISDINGEEELMMDAPGKLYNEDHFKDAFQASLAESFGGKEDDSFIESLIPDFISPPDFTIEVDGERVKPLIRSTPMTAKTKEYAVTYFNEDLNQELPLLDENGSPVSYRFDPGVTQEEVDRDNMLGHLHRERAVINERIKGLKDFVKSGLDGLLDSRDMMDGQKQEGKNIFRELFQDFQDPDISREVF